MLGKWFRRNFQFIILFAYILFATFVLFQMNSRLGYILHYPVRVSQEAREMNTRLREMQHIIPGLISNPDISYKTILDVLERQETGQDASLAIVREYFLGDQGLATRLEDDLAKLRKMRRDLALQLEDNSDYNIAMALYNSSIAHQAEMVNSDIKAILESAQSMMHSEQRAANREVYICIFLTAVFGLFVATTFFLLRKKEEYRTQQLLSRDQLFNELSQNVEETFIIAHGSKDFDFVSPNSSRIIGMNNEDLIESPADLYGFLPQDGADWLRHVLDNSAACAHEERDIDVAGGRSFKVLTTPLLDGAGSCKGTLVSMRDQTRDVERRQALMDALQSAHAASQAKSSFLSHMSHEIRTPMNAIIGMTTIALSKIGNQERVRDCLGKIGESSKHLLGIINDVLDMSKIENGKLSITNEPFSLHHVIQSVNDLVRPQADAHGLDFQIIPTNVEQDELIGDALRLNQILLNILSNALKFTPAGGKITFDIIELAKKHNKVRFRFVVSDNGIGMSEEFLQRLYKPFEQATQTTTAKYGGTGLGMSITLNLITLMGGTINVESKEGAGTRFSVELPFGFTRNCAETRENLPALRILVIDDDQGTCEHATLLLEQMGLTVRWCTNGNEGVEMLRRAKEDGEPYDLCLLDWKMPDMDGAQTARRIRESIGDDIVIIIISAYDITPIETEARNTGINDFIAKPFFSSTLYDTILGSIKGLGRPPVRKQTDEDSQINLEGKRIMLVEDNEFNREIGNEFLDMTRAAVENAKNGKEAVDMFTASRAGYYDLILMDVQMPIMNGYEATRAIRASSHPDAGTVPIIAMTANAFSEDVVEATAAGMNGHIAKPVDIKELFAILGKTLGVSKGGTE